MLLPGERDEAERQRDDERDERRGSRRRRPATRRRRPRRPEHAERGQHHADPELQRVLGDARQRRVHDDAGDRARRPARPRPPIAARPTLRWRAAEGHDDERDLEPFEEHALERDGERVPVVAARVRRARPRLATSARKIASSSCSALRPPPRRIALRSHCSPKISSSAADDEAQRRRSGCRVSAGPEDADDHRQRDERGRDAPERRAPAPRDADREHDRQRLDHLHRQTPGRPRRTTERCAWVLLRSCTYANTTG